MKRLAFIGLVVAALSGSCALGHIDTPNAAYDDGPYCAQPCSDPITQTWPPTIPNGVVGRAYQAELGPGLVGSTRPDLGRAGSTTLVCAGSPWKCIAIVLVGSCTCTRPSELMELGPDAYRALGGDARGFIPTTTLETRP